MGERKEVTINHPETHKPSDEQIAEETGFAEWTVVDFQYVSGGPSTLTVEEVTNDAEAEQDQPSGDPGVSEESGSDAGPDEFGFSGSQGSAEESPEGGDGGPR